VVAAAQAVEGRVELGQEAIDWWGPPQ